jgi:hypothetical protein
VADATDEKQLVKSFLARPMLSAERDLELLAKARAHKHADWLRCQLEFDREEWRALEGTDGEDYDGEAAERGELLDLARKLMSGSDD